MALARNEAFLLLLLFVGTLAFEDNNDLMHRLEATEKLVTSLSERVNLLESREVVHITRISDLESRDIEQQKTIEELRHQLQQKQHDSVKATFNDQQRQQQLHDPMETTENGPQQHYTNISRVPSHVDTLKTKQHNVRSVPRIQAALEAPVAFFARRIGGIMHEGSNQVLIFDIVQTNVGNAYNKRIGSFTAPVDGIYVFSTTMVANNRVNAHVSFFKNSDELNVMYASGAEAAYDSTSSTIALSLIKGDVISVRTTDLDILYLSSNFCTFTGFLLHELSTTPAVVG